MSYPLKRRQFANPVAIGYLDVDIFLPTDDPKSELLQLAQRQSSALVRSPVRASRDYVERLGKFQVYYDRSVLSLVAVSITYPYAMTRGRNGRIGAQSWYDCGLLQHLM
jgi:hypothetical protein